MDRMPCSHAIDVLQKSNLDPYDYCSSYYKKETMITAYIETVYPVENKNTWKILEEIKSVLVYPREG